MHESGITGLVLAGGQGRRMGTIDKGLVPLRGRAMVQHVLDRFRPQVDEIIINANQHRAEYEAFGHPVLSDAIGGFAGPLAGLQVGLSRASFPLIATVPCDSPFLPGDLVARLASAPINRTLYLRLSGAAYYRISRVFSKKAGARSTRGTLRSIRSKWHSTTKPTRFATSTPGMS